MNRPMRRRNLILLPASLAAASAVLFTPASFTVVEWMAPVGESAFAYWHPLTVTASAGLLPWMIAGMVRWRLLLRMRAIFVFLAWTLVATPLMGLIIFDERDLHGDHREILNQMRSGRERMRVPPRKAVDASLARGDCRPLALLGFGPVVPVLDTLAVSQRTAMQSYGYRVLPGTGDMLVSPGHMRYGWKVSHYSGSYNHHLLARLRTSAGRLDLARCDPAYSTRSPHLP